MVHQRNIVLVVVYCVCQAALARPAIEPISKDLARFAANASTLHKCEFSLQRIPGFNPLIKTDSEGRSCRGDVLLPFCFGMCKTRESGIHTFPYREQEGYMCAIIGDRFENVTLTDCDEGADPSIRHVLINKSTTCGCKPIVVKNSDEQ